MKMLECAHCKELIVFGGAFVDGDKIWHNESTSQNCARAAHMAEQGYPFQCPKCRGRGQEQVGWDEFFECYVCLGRGFLKKEATKLANGCWERTK